MQRDRERTNKTWNNCVISTGIRNSTKRKSCVKYTDAEIECVMLRVFNAGESGAREIINGIIFRFDAHSPIVRHDIKAFG